MAFGELGPEAKALATRLGRDAANLRRAGQPVPRCPWSTNDASVTKRRMAGAWLDAFIDGIPALQD